MKYSFQADGNVILLEHAGIWSLHYSRISFYSPYHQKLSNLVFSFQDNGVLFLDCTSLLSLRYFGSRCFLLFIVWHVLETSSTWPLAHCESSTHFFLPCSHVGSHRTLSRVFTQGSGRTDSRKSPGPLIQRLEFSHTASPDDFRTISGDPSACLEAARLKSWCLAEITTRFHLSSNPMEHDLWVWGENHKNVRCLRPEVKWIFLCVKGPVRPSDNMTPLLGSLHRPHCEHTALEIPLSLGLRENKSLLWICFCNLLDWTL